jgi:hypothetical protein
MIYEKIMFLIVLITAILVVFQTQTLRTGNIILKCGAKGECEWTLEAKAAKACEECNSNLCNDDKEEE